MEGGCGKTKESSCPAGYMLRRCENTGDKYRCEVCAEGFYQPNENWNLDKCRIKSTCDKRHMFKKDEGSTTRNSECGCMPGYHFPSKEDPYKCRENSVCEKGYAPGEFGGCESCLDKGMYSDTRDNKSLCKPLKNCEKQGRCIKTHSDGTKNNICGPKVSDLKTCKEIEGQGVNTSMLMIAIPVVALIIGILLLFVLTVFFIRRKKYKSHYCNQKLTSEQSEELKQKIIKTSDKDPAFCKKSGEHGLQCYTRENWTTDLGSPARVVPSSPTEWRQV